LEDATELLGAAAEVRSGSFAPSAERDGAQSSSHSSIFVGEGHAEDAPGSLAA
jgi:hypothetical protein